MKLLRYSNDLKDAPVQLIAVGVFRDETSGTSAFENLDQWLDGALSESCREEDFKGKPGQQVVVTLPRASSVRRVLVCGLGAREHFDPDLARRFGGEVAKLARKTGLSSAAIYCPETEGAELRHVMQAAAEGVSLGAYRYTEHLSDKGREDNITEIHLAVGESAAVDETEFAAMAQRVDAVTHGVTFARDLINMPPNELYPGELANRATEMANKRGLECTILDASELEKEKMHLHLGVGCGSSREPKLIHVKYTPTTKTSDRVIALVGKGLTFDAGGLSLKPADAMITMKIDMGGAAAVLGAMEAIAISQPGCTVHGLVGAAENMPDGAAIRPGDIITGKKGISVEILNTDAEGRLVLADVLAYCQELKPSEIVNLATLTGACMVALGPHTAGAFVRDENLHERLEKAWRVTGEKFWRMPLSTELREQLESDVADIKNVGERWGGAITAGLFLSEFVDRNVPWAHLDVAGPVFATKPKGYIPKGGTGFAVRTLVEYVHQSAEEPLTGA